MVFKIGVKNIQAAGYNGARTVIKTEPPHGIIHKNLPPINSAPPNSKTEITLLKAHQYLSTEL